ncbi:uncharacterized protein BT62DRAFT_938700 [Guyanagaster necrorhizus]|uniref:Uncharacterized protein n=1 Tax=Guyanagaster necrorhizus TaxID=856835 RepID=A0A9P8AMC8_9AGAR|nr:uncharacterized protein BT62DRAFT_938700 [Guyanagaster necrorhizus MCA 3950]KAG7439717.1 hypothetical protein BT62DRAFT_938700 [Guyanagaster necrorhizus MCA 3950]
MPYWKDMPKFSLLCYKVGMYRTVIRCRNGTQYYLFNFDTDNLHNFTERYPMLEAFMERSALWFGGDERIYSLIPFAVMEINPGLVPPKDLEDVLILARTSS